MGVQVHAQAQSSDFVPSLPPPTHRLDYLDNLKAALTVIVLVHHVVGAFVGGGNVGLGLGQYASSFQPLGVLLQILDQSYFMCLFFFISGYMTPASLDRKGVLGFLTDRLRRLGLPFLAYFFVLSPLLGLFVDQVAVGGRAVAYNVTCGPTWFICWVLLFSSAYASIGGESIMQLPLPSTPVLLLAGGGLGMVQAAQVLFFPVYFLMPITFGSLPFDVVFFACGVAAKRNNWLDKLAAMSPGMLRIFQAAVVTLTLYFGGLIGWMFADGGGYAILPINSCGSPVDRGINNITSASGFINAFLWVSAGTGVYCVAVCVVAEATFRRYCDFSSRFTRYFSDNAFTAYLIHPFVVVPLTWTYAAFCTAAFGASFSHWDGEGNSYDCLTSASLRRWDDAVLVLGFVYTSVLTVALVYPLSSCIRRIPCMKQALG